MNMLRSTASPDAARRWPVVLSGALGMFMAVVYLYVIGPTIEPLEREFGWHRDHITSAFMIINVLAVLVTPLVGMLIDRFGARRVAIPGTVAYIASIALLAATGPGIGSWWLGAFIMGVALCFVTSTTWVAGVASHFVARRGFVIALCLVGSTVSAAVVPYTATYVTDHYGWRAAYLVIAGFCAAVVLPAVYLWFTDARVSTVATQVEVHAEGLSRRQVLASRQYWQLAVAGCLFSTGDLGLIVHFVPILSDAGVARGTAAGIAGAIGVGAILGRLICGYLLDRLPGGLVGGVAFLIPIIPALMLQDLAGSLTLLTISAFSIGLAMGAETDLVAYVSARFFGLRNYGFAFGSLIGFMSLGVGIGPWIGGVVFNAEGSYALFLRLIAGALFVSASLMALIGPYPAQTRQPAA